MSEQDIQLIRKAVQKRWLFWLYFWRIPRYLKAMADEMDRVWAEEAKFLSEKSSIEQARDEAMKANKNVLRWVHVTHRLSTTPEGIRALFAAGKRLSVLLLFLAVAMPLNAQLPPILRQYFTTNAHVLSSGAGVLTNNGVGTPGTLGWLSLTNLFGGNFTNITSGDFILKTNGLGLRTTFQEWISVTNSGGINAQITNGGFQGAAFLSSSPGSYAKADAGGFAGATFDASTNCFTRTVWNAMGGGYYLNSTNCRVVPDTGAFASGHFTRCRDCRVSSTEGSFAGAWFTDSQACNINSFGGGLGGAGFAINSNCTVTVDIGVGFGYFLANNASLIARQGSLAIGSVTEGSRLFASESAMAVGRDLASTNSWTFGHSYTNNRNFSFDVGFQGVRQFGVASNGLMTIENIDYNWPNAHAVGALTNDGSGGLGWFNGYAPATGGGYISSVFTNNVLAGGPGLTELGFTNSSTAVVTATTNAGRSTVSFDTRTNNAGVFVVQGTSDNGLYIAQTPAVGSGSLRLGYTNPKLGLERTGVGHFIWYDTAVGDTWMDAVFGGAKLNFAIGGTAKWQVANAGHFLATTDNTVDIGASGATRPRNVYIAGATTIGGGITNDALTASKLVRTDATKKLVSSTLDESDIAAKQAGSAVLTNLSTTRAVTNMTVTTITNVGVSLYTVPSGCAYIFVECIGGGGGGGGVDGATSQSAAGGGGGSGAYCATNITTPAASYIVTVGTNGLGGAAGNNNGTIGGTTTFTNILTALGGSGGSGDASAAGVGFAVGGAGALQTATGRVYTGGNPGHNGICVSSALAVSGGGAGSHFGGGGAPQTADVGQNATGKGAGGSGAAVITNADRAGGNGSPGIIVIREFYQ